MTYYHILVLYNHEFYEQADIPAIEDVESKYVYPYIRKEEMFISGTRIFGEGIEQLRVFKSDMTKSEIQGRYAKTKARIRGNWSEYINALVKFADEITNEVIEKCKADVSSETNINDKTEVDLPKDKVFIVHGHDDSLKTEVETFVNKLGFKPIVLHRQANSGKTIIEKIEEYTNEVGFAIVLYTPCDVGRAKGEEQPKKRARQNVVLEHGFLMGKIGRKNIVPLVSDNDIELPNDISGIVYVNKPDWKIDIAKEMKAAGYAVDMNKLCE